MQVKNGEKFEKMTTIYIKNAYFVDRAKFLEWRGGEVWGLAD